MENQNRLRQNNQGYQSFWKKNTRAVPGRFVTFCTLEYYYFSKQKKKINRKTKIK